MSRYSRHDTDCIQDYGYLPAEVEEAEAPIDWTRPVRTKRTKAMVRIISTDGPKDQPIVGVFEADEELANWSADGVFACDGTRSGLDLENA